MQILGLDLGSNAMLKITRARGGAFDVLLRTSAGDAFTGTAGMSVLMPSGNVSDRLDCLSIVHQFPFLLPHYLDKLPQDTYRREQHSDGSVLYTCSLVSGSIAATIRGLPEGFTAASHQVDYKFDPSGRLHSIHRHSTDETEILTYIDDAKDQKLAIPKSFANGGWVLHDYEIYPEGRPDLFTPEAVTARARDMLIAHNERQRELKQSPESQRQLAKSIEQLGGEASPHRTKRFALIITGLIVIAVGSLAWWKNRS